MDVYTLRSFVVLAEHLHFSRAAKVLNLSQPALTKQIRNLESEVGSVLFERGHRGTRLSAVGEQWLPLVREVLERFEQVATFARATAKGGIGRLRIGFGYHTLQLVPDLVVKLRAAAPGVQITLRDMSTAEQSAALDAGELDIGFMRMPLRDTRGYETLPVIEDRLALVSSPQFGRTTSSIALEDCRDVPFVSISKDRSPGFYHHMLKLCAAHGFHPRIVQEVSEFTTALGLVRAGMGVTMIPESSWSTRFTDVRLHHIADKRSIWRVAAVWRRGDTNPALLDFIDMLQEVLERKRE